MTEAQVKETFDALIDAIERGDENASRTIAIALGSVVVSSWVRIAAALEHIGRNIPSK